MLTEDEISDLWDRRITAEVRSLYFGDLANLLSVRKQWITGISFFFSSGAAATLIAKGTTGSGQILIPISLSIVVALMNAYSVAVNLDLKIRTMSKLQTSWSELSNEYRRLWNRTWAEDAQKTLDACIERELDLSELAATNAPNDQKRMGRWQTKVFELYHLDAA